MPRKRTKAEPPTQRSRKGCNRCRARKVRCDQVKPVCGQCLAKGFDCATTISLKWETEYVGRAFGRAGVWSKSPAGASPSGCTASIKPDMSWCEVPTIHHYSFVNATVGDVDDLIISGLGNMTAIAYPVALHNDRDDSSSTASLSPWMSERLLDRPLDRPWSWTSSSLTSLPHLKNGVYSGLMAYYIDRLCPLTIPSSSAKSPFASLLLPFSLCYSPAVFDAMLALAACHRSKYDVNYKSPALRLGDKVLRRLRLRLATEDPRQVALDPETVVVMMLLCQYEIINECDKRWVVHLKGARDLIRFRRQAARPPSQTSSESDLVAFSEKFFAFQDVIGRTACVQEPVFGSDFWTTQGDETDPWLGCSPALVSIICEITELSRQHRLDPTVFCSLQFQAQAASLERRLGCLQQRVLDDDDDILETAAELKRSATELYLHCALYGACPTTPVVKHCVQQVLRLVFLLLTRNVLAGLTWPVFVAAVALDPDEDLQWVDEDEGPEEVPVHARPFILYVLNKMTNSVANVSRTRSVILQVWQIRESDETCVRFGQINDWERFVAPFCGNMSLA